MIQALLPSLIGIIAALVAVWLTDFFARRREARAEGRARDAEHRRQDFERNEALRRETTQRKLNALENAAASLAPALNDLRALRAAAEKGEFPDRISGAISIGCAGLRIHFGEQFENTVALLEDQYGNCLKAISSLALAASWLIRRRDGLSADDGVAGERQNYNAAQRDCTSTWTAFEKSLPNLLCELKEEAKKFSV